MQRLILAAALLGFGFAAPAFAAKNDRGPVVYGAAVGSSTTLKEYTAAGNKRAAGSKQATAAQAKAAAPSPEGRKKNVAKKPGIN